MTDYTGMTRRLTWLLNHEKEWGNEYQSEHTDYKKWQLESTNLWGGK